MAMRLNYRGTVLLPADIKLLAGPHWLNDTILSFLLEHYEQDEFPHLAQDVCIMEASTAQMVGLWYGSPSELAMTMEYLNLGQKKMILLPLSDHANPDTGNPDTAHGGSHWALLAYRGQQFELYDSLGARSGVMVAKATAIAALLKGAFGLKGSAKVCVMKSPSQTNGYDCGMYVACTAHYLCSTFSASDRQHEHVHAEGDKDAAATFLAALCQRLTPAAVASKRGESLELVTRLIADAAQKPDNGCTLKFKTENG